MNSKTHVKALAALTLASIFWGANGPIMKLALASVPIFSLAFLRFGFASLLLLTIVAKKLSVKRQDFPRLVACSLCGIGLHIPLYFAGLRLTSAINAGIIIASLPLFTLFLAHIFLREKIRPILIASGVLGMLGILIIIGKDVVLHGFSLSPLGDFLILASTLLFVGFEILSKKLFKVYDPLTVTFYSFVFGSVLFLPGVLYEFYSSPWYLNLPPAAIIGILYGIFFSSFGSYNLWQWGLSQIPASRVGFFFHLDPVVSTIFAVVILSEQITLPFILGSVFIFAALFLAEGRIPISPFMHKIRRRS